MPRYHYDLHMHSALSPCADDDMTPFNMVNMAALAGLDIIALTDHNSCKNAPAFLEAAKRAGIAALPGMELCCAEECHVVCLLPTPEAARAFDAYIEGTLPPVQNDPAVFGQQLMMDAEDTVTGRYGTLLTTASSVSVDEVVVLVRRYGGAAFPAHIDRPSYSVVASLGTVPPVGFEAVEISRAGDADALCAAHELIRGLPLLLNSDAHSLGLIQDPGPWLELPEKSPEALIAALDGRAACAWGR